MSVPPSDLQRVNLQMPREVRLDDALLFAICQAKRDYRIERSANGDIQIMPPTGGETNNNGSQKRRYRNRPW